MKIIVLTSLVLHNLLCTKSADSYTPPGFTDEIFSDSTVNKGSWREENISSVICPSGPKFKGNRRRQDAESIRDAFAEYFLGPGEVE